METDKAFVGSIPALYDRYLGPLMFEPYAADLASRVAALRPAHVLEIAAGTGIVTSALLRGLDGGATIVATDLNQPMLDHAARVVQDSRVTWRQADALALPFADATFDAVACQFGVMFFPDRPRAYAEARRVLRPGGAFVFSVWSKLEENQFADTVNRALARRFEADPPMFLARTPYGCSDTAAITEQVSRAGFVDIAVATVAKESAGRSPRDVATGFCEGSPLRGEIEARDPSGVAVATAAAEAALASRFGDGPIVGRMQAHVVTAYRPAAA